MPLKPGAVITNEPGFYKEGSFGIRIESALVVKTARVKDPQGAEVNWLAFERFTHVRSIYPLTLEPDINHFSK